MKFLKKLSATVPTNSLKYRLHQHLSTFDPHRGVNVIHASELSKDNGICPRFYALAEVAEAKLSDRSTSTSENATWELGRLWQDRLVNWLSDIGIGYSHWKCENANCNQLHKYCLRPEQCKCGNTAFAPVEPRFQSDKNGASCGVDVIVSYDGVEFFAVEIKTMDKDEFKKLAAPLAEHRLRTNFYLRIISESKDPFAKKLNKKKAFVFYTSKGGYGCADTEVRSWGFGEFFSPFKEYEIKRDDKQTQEMADRAMVAHEFRKGIVGMPYGVCVTALEERAKKCDMRKPCFSGEFPPAYDWMK